jgi:hypothetical protein
MRRLAVLFGAGVLGMAAGLPLAAQDRQQARAPTRPLNTLNDLRDAIRGCWQWPPLSEIRTGMQLTILLSFKASGEIFGARIVYETRDVSPEERAIYHGALINMLRLCSPLPLTEGFAGAIAGQPFRFRFNDNRLERRAEASHGQA